MAEEKKRSANFTPREKDLLISLVEKHLKIIECKKTNSVFNKQKQECWEKLAGEFNALQTTGKRTGVQLKTLYEQLKKQAKQHQADIKVEILKTGGGVIKDRILSSQDEKILGLLKEKYFSIDNEFDSNSNVRQNEDYFVTPSTSLLESDSNTNMGQMEAYFDTPSTSKKFNSVNTFFEQSFSVKRPINTEDDLVSFSNNNTEIIFDETELDNKLSSDEDQSQSLLQPQLMPQTKKNLAKKLKKNDENVSNVLNVNKKSKSFNRSHHKNKINRDATTAASETDLRNKKMEIYEKKLQILNIVQENEEESLRGKKIDNHIKEIILEKELLELQIKRNLNKM